MSTAWSFLGILGIVVYAAIAILVVVLTVLLCRLAIAARENQLATARLRELQIERMLAEDDSADGQDLS